MIVMIVMMMLMTMMNMLMVDQNNFQAGSMPQEPPKVTTRDDCNDVNGDDNDDDNGDDKHVG